MSPVDSWITMALWVFGGTYAAWGGLVAMVTVGDRWRDRLERRAWRTLWTRSCPSGVCNGRVWEIVPHPFDPDLGATYDRSEVCPACRHDGNQLVEFDLDTVTLDEIKALDRAHRIVPDVRLIG